MAVSNLFIVHSLVRLYYEQKIVYKMYICYVGDVHYGINKYMLLLCLYFYYLTGS